MSKKKYDINVNVLIAAKEEYTKQLTIILGPLIYNGIIDIYNESQLIKKYRSVSLKNFQILLKKIPDWNQIQIDRYASKILEKCPYLMNLVNAIFISNVKILSCVKFNKNSKNIKIKVPSSEFFIHKIYITIAETLFSKPDIILSTKENIIKIISDTIETAIRNQIPINTILNEYLSNLNNIDSDSNSDSDSKSSNQISDNESDNQSDDKSNNESDNESDNESENKSENKLNNQFNNEFNNELKNQLQNALISENDNKLEEIVNLSNNMLSQDILTSVKIIAINDIEELKNNNLLNNNNLLDNNNIEEIENNEENISELDFNDDKKNEKIKKYSKYKLTELKELMIKNNLVDEDCDLNKMKKNDIIKILQNNIN